MFIAYYYFNPHIQDIFAPLYVKIFVLEIFFVSAISI